MAVNLSGIVKAREHQDDIQIASDLYVGGELWRQARPSHDTGIPIIALEWYENPAIIVGRLIYAKR